VVDCAHNIIEAMPSRYYGAIFLKITVDYREKTSGLIDLFKKAILTIQISNLTEGQLKEPSYLLKPYGIFLFFLS